MKVYGYSYYSSWFNFGPQSGYADYFGANSLDYELWSHTRGVNISLLDQVNSRNLVTLEGSLTQATTVRDNNTQFFNGLYGTNTVNARTLVTALVDSSNPLNGLCYTAAGVATTCSLSGTAQFGSIGQAVKGTLPAAVGICGGGPCENLVVGNGNYATYNTVKPNFLSMSLTDSMKATDKLNLDFGIRLDSFGYGLADTTQSAARTFFYNSFNLDTCLDANNNLLDKVDEPRSREPARGVSGRHHGGQLHQPGWSAEPDVHRLAAAHCLHVQRQPGDRDPWQLWPLHPGAEQRVRAVRHPPSQRSGAALRRVLVPEVRLHVARSPDRAADVEQLRPLARAPVHRRRFGETLAVLPLDAEPDPAVLPQPADRVRLGPQRRSADLEGLRVRT